MARKNTLVIVVALCVLTIEATAQNASRLIGRSQWEWDNTLWEFDDSATYHYSPGKGGDIESFYTESMQYDSSMQVTLYQGNIVPYRKSIQTLDGNGNVLQRLTTQNNLTTFVNYRLYDHTYDVSNNRLTDTLKNWVSNVWVNQVRRVRTFDMNNNLLSIETANWNSGTSQWENVTASFYTYNGNLQIDEKTASWNTGTSQWDSMGWKHYDWTTGNLIDTISNFNYISGWVPTSRVYYIYDGNNNNTNQWSQVWNSGSNTFETNKLTNMTYDGNNNKINDTAFMWDDVNNAFYTERQNTYWYDGNNNMEKWIVKLYDTMLSDYENVSWDSMAFNSYNQMTYHLDLDWNTTLNDWGNTNNDNVYYFYYELYTASINDIGNAASDLLLYPVPASTTLNVRFELKQPQATTISVYDMSGRVAMQWTEPSVTEYRKYIPIDHLAAGNYLLQVRAGGKNIQKQFCVIK